MVDGGDAGPAFPVVFFDGEREMNIGNVNITPKLEYKPFQLMLSQKIGISPNQISIYLADRRKNSRSPFADDRRRIPITGKVNFGLICRQKDCCFLVVLKRSRKSRSRRDRLLMNGVDFSDYSPPAAMMHPPPENLILLRRNDTAPFYDQITAAELADLNDRLERLRAHRESYEIAMSKGRPELSSGQGFGPNCGPDSYPNIGDIHRGGPVKNMMTMMTKDGTEKAFCEGCVNARKDGGTVSFHLCVNDPVFTRFGVKRLGPINRPNKTVRW